MSIEIRQTPDGKHLECDWGGFENGEADPHRELKPLMLTTADYVKKIMDEGPLPGPRGGIHGVSVDGERVFAHLDYCGGRTTWELFKAYWWDGGGPEDVMVGRWPD